MCPSDARLTLQLVQQLLELHADGGGKADEQSEGGSSGTSARELKQQRKMAVAELKDIVPSGDTVLLVEPLLKVRSIALGPTAVSWMCARARVCVCVCVCVCVLVREGGCKGGSHLIRCPRMDRRLPR